MVDVKAGTIINRPRAEVASYAADPSTAPEWYSNIKQVRLETEPPLAVGSRMAFVAKFLGRTLEYTYEIVELAPGSSLTMRTAQGPFPMQTQYTWVDAGAGRTLMTLRNTGTPAGFSRLAALVMKPMMRRAMKKDLARIKSLLEGQAA